MESCIMKRSSWDSGSGCVPDAPRGFCVAMQINGLGSGWVTPSTVTFFSSMDTKSADWVFGEVRLTSSASSRWHITAPL